MRGRVVRRGRVVGSLIFNAAIGMRKTTVAKSLYIGLPLSYLHLRAEIGFSWLQNRSVFSMCLLRLHAFGGNMASYWWRLQ